MTEQERRWRRCLVLRGGPAQTRTAACELLVELPASAVAWIGEDGPEGACVVPPRKVAGLLGRSFDAVVIDAHAGFDADALGQAHGLVWGGGALILRRPSLDEPPPSHGDPGLAAHPYGPHEVTRRFEARIERALVRCAEPPGAALLPARHATTGTREQAGLVDHLVQRWSVPSPTRIAVLADRGRGKSSALGLAIRRWLARSTGDVVVTAGHREAVAEVLRFAEDAKRLRWVEASRLAMADVEGPPPAVLVVDEAAQLPVPLLQRLVRRFPAAHLAFATTTHGYEGTGRGFSLRFLAWLEGQGLPVERRTLTEPIRWSAGDPVERFAFEALLLDAEIAERGPADDDDHAIAELEVLDIDRDALAEDEPRLRALFGLLVHAHYRTTPGDLHRLLDAPNLALHAMACGDRIVAATVVAHEGGLPEALCEEVLRGRTRLRAHALPDTLVSHLGHARAGSMSMVRSVRIAVHPAWRRHGLATRLVQHVHRRYAPDLFGTIFGATPELVAFRRSVGYEIGRISASRGSRTGEPAVMMLRPVTDRARTLMQTLREDLARALPTQLALLRADDALLFSDDLTRALMRGLPSPRLLDEAAARAAVHRYAHGPCTFESVAVEVIGFVQAHRDRLDTLDTLDPRARSVVEGRVLARRGWRRVAEDAGLPSVTAAMRLLRRAVRTLVEHAHDELPDPDPRRR